MADVLRVLESGARPDPVADVIGMAAGALGMDGMAVSLATDDGLTELLWCSDGTTRRFEDLQLTLGEGPGPDVVRTGAMVWVPDLAGVRPARWPAQAMEAPDLMTRAVFCFPLGIGAIRVGVLTAVRRTPGAMSAQQTDDALILANALTVACLGSGAEPPGAAPPAQVPQALQRAVVHQATGMVSVQLAVSLPQALLRLRGHAYSSGRSITDVSKDVVDRRLRLGHSLNGADPSTEEEKD
jgi:hypothetical protein